MNKLEKTLSLALSAASVKTLPQKTENNELWMGAIALVEKNDGGKEYVLMDKDKNNQPHICRSFGSCAAIINVLEIYPYKGVDEKYIKKFSSNSRETRIRYLKQYYSIDDDRYEKTSLSDLNKEILKIAIKKQLKDEND